jgi:2-polyprenyl-3-methyl-5-hydroxy-6-metoxy-1,4-benzoquinol methylase
MQDNNSEFIISGNGERWAFIKPANPDSLLDSISEAQFKKDRFLPYWAELWPAAEVLFEYVAAKAFAANARICDLGCGLGIISAIMAARGNHVIAADISPKACEYARANILRYSRRACPACCDWRSPAFNEAFDIILAADVLYEQQCLEPVIDFLDGYAEKNGRAIIADPCRSQWETFKSRIITRCFAIEKLLQKSVNNGKTKIEIIELRKK